MKQIYILLVVVIILIAFLYKQENYGWFKDAYCSTKSSPLSCSASGLWCKWDKYRCVGN